jgi:hypothetical protein
LNEFSLVVCFCTSFNPPIVHSQTIVFLYRLFLPGCLAYSAALKNEAVCSLAAINTSYLFLIPLVIRGPWVICRRVYKWSLLFLLCQVPVYVFKPMRCSSRDRCPASRGEPRYYPGGGVRTRARSTGWTPLR